MTDINGLSKEKFAFFLPGLYDGGAERIMLNLAKGMVNLGHPVDLVLARAEGPFMDDIPDSVRLVDLRARRVSLSAATLAGYLRRERPSALLSVLHANIIALWASRLAGGTTRIVLAEHNTLSSVAQGEHDLRWNLFPLLARGFYPWADAIIAVSKGVAEDLAKTIRMPADRIRVVYNPIVTPDMFERARQPVDHPWFGTGQPPVLLAVGRLTPQKGFDILLKAFARVRKKRSVRLLILGEGDTRPALEKQIRELELEHDASLPGFISNPYPFIAHAAAFILSSRWEGLPTVLVEALALGVPVIATDCPSGPREILMGGQFGRLTPMDDPEGLAEAIESTLAAPRGDCPKEAWAPFTSETAVAEYIRALRGK